MSDVEEINVGEPCLYAQEAMSRATKKLSRSAYRVLFTLGTGEDGQYCNEVDIESFYDGRVILVRGDLDLQKTLLHQSNPLCYYMYMFNKNASVWWCYDK